MLQLAARPSRLESILSDLSAVDSSQPRSVGSLYGRGPTTQCRGWWGRFKGVGLANEVIHYNDSPIIYDQRDYYILQVDIKVLYIICKFHIYIYINNKSK